MIGSGGIGGHLVEPLIRYLGYVAENSEVTIIDGDKFEQRNMERQRFTACENKADHTANMLKNQFPKVHVKSKPEYVTQDNVVSIVRENDIIFLCVDNHATRKLISDRCEELSDVTLISGGNDYTDGNVIIFRRVDGKDVGRAPTKIHPAINNPTDKNPGSFTDAERQGCQQEAISHPQLLFTNLAIASTMLNCYYAIEQGKANFEQVYVDILTQRSRPSPS